MQNNTFPRPMKKPNKQSFKGISLEQKWKDRMEFGTAIRGNKSGNRFLVTDLKYNGQEKQKD